MSFLKLLAGNSGYHFHLVNAVIEVNSSRCGGDPEAAAAPRSLRGKQVALLGLAFKPGTDDMRDAPSKVIAARLIAEEADVRVWDPVARPDDLLRGVVAATRCSRRSTTPTRP